ncbi:protein kinase domain-containing protein [Ditylenchus destructor]|uniref:Protein kinase domain-containing protein n=1 Tax=Ditylenchus destructor TaxID=166010 RepID=A0AAD4QX07_9BILA|nr:protein kinase domain-containing protein [Ditylenchus destructor]
MVALIDNVKSLSEAQVALYMFQILKGVEEMHNRNYVHGDLKMENVLLAGQKTILQPYLMIADFDQAFDVTKVKGGKIVGKSGSPTYMSPQVIREEPYAMDADMWAVGVIAYALLYRYKPFADDNETLAGNVS